MICPPKINDPEKFVLAASTAGPSRERTSRTASPTNRAARYIDGTVSMVVASDSASIDCSFKRLMTDWVSDRLPAASKTIARSPGTHQK